MEIKETILKYKRLIIISLVIALLTSLIMVFTNNPEPEIVEEEVIELIPYKDYEWKNLKHYKKYSYEDDNYTSMYGIDVAAHQGTINWKKVKEAGVEFAYIRLGYRGASEGLLNTDLEFENNYQGAIDNDIKVGIYWYSQPISKQEAIEEAQYVIDVLNDRHIDLPIVYDFEETFFYDGTISRMHDMSKQDRTTMAEAFCGEIKNHGYEPMIYTNLSWSKTYYDWSRLSDYPIWFAQYGTNYPIYDRPFVMWQYTDTGTIDGIDTYVDFDILFIYKNDQN